MHLREEKETHLLVLLCDAFASFFPLAFVEASLVANPPSQPRTQTTKRATRAMQRLTPARRPVARASLHDMYPLPRPAAAAEPTRLRGSFSLLGFSDKTRP